MDAIGHTGCWWAGDQVDDALAMARVFRPRRGRCADRLAAPGRCVAPVTACRNAPRHRVQVRAFDRTDHATMDAALADFTGGPITGAIMMPTRADGLFPWLTAAKPAMRRWNALSTMSWAVPSRWRARSAATGRNARTCSSEPRFVFLTNGERWRRQRLGQPAALRRSRN
jgi:hypothetical protein